MRVAANPDLREIGADNARIISAVDPPYDRRRAPPLPTAASHDPIRRTQAERGEA